MPQATFTADFSQWKSAMDNASKQVKAFEYQLTGLRPAIQRMTSALDGSQIKREAEIAVEAVKKIGGAAMLTEAEQRKVNATVTEAIAKYKALGQVAPKELLDIANATKTVGKETAKATNEVGLIGAGMKALGPTLAASFSIGALTSFVSSLVDAGSAIADMSARTGIGTEALQRLQAVGRPAGVSLETIASAANLVSRKIALNDDSAVAAFKQLGLSVDRLRAMQPDEAFTEIGAALAGIDDPMQRAALGFQVFGKRWDEVSQMVTKDMKETAKNASIMSDATVQKLDAIGDAWEELKARTKNAIALVVTFNPLADLGAKIRQSIDEVNKLSQVKIPSGFAPKVTAPGIPGEDELRSLYVTLDQGNEKWNKHLATVEKAGEAYRKWRDRVLGLDKALEAADLEKRFTALNASGKLTAEATKAIIAEYDKLRPSLEELPPILEAIRTDYQDVIESTRLFGGAMTELMRVTINGDRMFKEGQTAVRQFGVHLEYLKSTSIDVAIAMQAVPKAITGISTAAKAFDPTSFANRLKGAFKNIAQDLPNILLGAFTGELRGEQLGKALGASIGAAIGAAFGGVIGAAVGGAIGQGIAEMFSTKAEQTARRVAREFGANIGEEMGQAIVDRAKLMFQGNQAAAQIFSLPDIIQAAGGLNAFNIGPMFDRLHDVFTMIQTGAFSAAQGMEVLDKTFKQFADFVTDRGTLASKQLLDIIKLNEQYGTSSKAVAEFVTAQITGAFTGLTTFLDNAKVSSNEAASSISAAIFGAFEALQKQGASPLDAFNAIAPALEKLDAQLKATGLDGGAAFQTMMQYAAIAKDAVAGPLLTAIAGLNDALHGLHNAGVLNQEMFGGLAKQVSDTYNQLVLAGKGGQQALQLIAPTLQTLWEEMTDFGYVVDDATKALIDQGVAAGLVGDKQRSAQDKMLKAVERTAEAVEALAHLFGATLPSDIQKTTDAINKIPRNVNIGVKYTDSGFTPQPTAPTGGTGTRVSGHAAGGVFTQPHLAYVAEGGQAEMVGSVGFMTRALEGALARVQTSGGVTVIPVVIQGSASPDDADAILAALVRAEPRITGNAGGVRSALRRALGR